jgi:hypothetical protein
MHHHTALISAPCVVVERAKMHELYRLSMIHVHGRQQTMPRKGEFHRMLSICTSSQAGCQKTGAQARPLSKKPPPASDTARHQVERYRVRSRFVHRDIAILVIKYTLIFVTTIELLTVRIINRHRWRFDLTPFTQSRQVGLRPIHSRVLCHIHLERLGRRCSIRSRNIHACMVIG